MDSAMDSACRPEFEECVGVAPADSRLDHHAMFTDGTGWDSGDHTRTCMLFDPDLPELTGSLRGSAP